MTTSVETRLNTLFWILVNFLQPRTFWCKFCVCKHHFLSLKISANLSPSSETSVLDLAAVNPFTCKENSEPGWLVCLLSDRSAKIPFLALNFRFDPFANKLIGDVVNLGENVWQCTSYKNTLDVPRHSYVVVSGAEVCNFNLTHEVQWL